MTITIHGGNSRIFPNAAEVIRNFYMGKYCEGTSLEEGDGRPGLIPKTIRFRAYVDKKEDLEYCPAQIIEYRTVTELARVILVMWEGKLKITPEEMIKGRFIRLSLPITPRIAKGRSASNVHVCISDVWGSHLGYRPTGRF